MKASGASTIPAPGRQPKVEMPSACQSGGCGVAPSAVGSRAAPPSFGAVIVNGVEIEPEAIARETQYHPAPSGEGAWMRAARALAVRELLLQEARRLKIEPIPEQDETGLRETEEEALIRGLLEQELDPPTAGEEECRRFYDASPNRFTTPELFEVSHILIEPEGAGEEAWAAAEAEARAIALAVGDDPIAFAEAARQFSKCPTAHQGGSLGQLRRGELVPSIEQAIASMAEGTTGREVVRSRFGWHVLRLQRRIQGKKLPFEFVKDKIRDMLDARAWTLCAARYAAELARSARIEGVVIDPDALGLE